MPVLDSLHAARRRRLPRWFAIGALAAAAGYLILGRRDRTLALARDPYRFIGRERARRGNVDAFETRLLLEPTVCMAGSDAARLFYDSARFRRADAAPEPLRATLFGKGAVQSLDGAAHAHRKALFNELLNERNVARLARFVAREWDRAVDRWSAERKIVLYRAVQPVLARAVFDWAGVPLREREAARRTRQLVALFDSAASGPLAHLRARVARKQLEHWAAALVIAERAGRGVFARDGAAQAIAQHRDTDARLLPARIAAVELLNVLRPVIAVSVFIVHAAHALARHPEARERIARDPHGAYLEAFVQEVRRFYPFFPAAVARSRTPFEWHGVRFASGERVLLDLHGTHRDPRLWSEPERFDPDRFLGRAADPFELIPQGGGNAANGHRCPGEAATIAIMKVAIDRLARRMRYRLPPQDLRIELTRLPALPADRLILAEVRRAESATRSSKAHAARSSTAHAARSSTASTALLADPH